MSILDNAVDSIAIGLEDYSSPDERRVISCARNIFAGILLLFKHKLSLLSEPGSDEALIKQRVLPAMFMAAFYYVGWWLAWPIWGYHAPNVGAEMNHVVGTVGGMVGLFLIRPR